MDINLKYARMKKFVFPDDCPKCGKKLKKEVVYSTMEKKVGIMYLKSETRKCPDYIGYDDSSTNGHFGFCYISLVNKGDIPKETKLVTQKEPKSRSMKNEG